MGNGEWGMKIRSEGMKIRGEGMEIRGEGNAEYNL